MPARRRSINDKLVFVFPDIHFPFQDDRALECALKAHEALRPARTIQLGDILDCEAFSRHPRTSVTEKRTDYIVNEITPARAFTDRCLKNTRHFQQLGGNHEFRPERICAEMGSVGPSVFAGIDPKRLLGQGRASGEWGWTPYVEAGNPMPHYRINKSLIAVHGWSYAKNCAEVHLASARHFSVVFGHVHREAMAVSRNPVTNSTVRAWSPGCLALLQQPYETTGKPNDHTHGFSIIYCGSDGRSFTQYVIGIDNGRCVLPDGTQVQA